MCEHKWMYLDTRYICEKYSYTNSFKRVDRFYCEKCCEIKEVEKYESDSRNVPIWFNKNNYETIDYR